MLSRKKKIFTPRDSFLYAIKQQNIKLLECAFKQHIDPYKHIDFECSVLALKTFDIKIIKKILFDAYEHDSKPKYSSITKGDTYDNIIKIFKQIDATEEEYLKLVQIFFDLTNSSKMCEIVLFLIYKCNASIFLNNIGFWKIIINDFFKRYTTTYTYYEICTMIMNNLLYRFEVSKFIQNTKILELLFNFDETITIDNFIKLITYVTTLERNKDVCYLLNCFLRIMKQYYGVETMIAYFTTKILLPIFDETIKKFNTDSHTTKLMPIYNVLVIANVKENYNDVVEYFLRTDFVKKTLELNSVLNFILNHTLITNDMMMPYIMILMKKLHTKLELHVIERIRHKSTNKKKLILYSIAADFYHGVFYKYLTEKETKYLEELEKTNIKQLIPHLNDFVISPLVQIIASYMGHFHETCLIY